MEFVTQLNWIDLLILILLVGGVFLGWTQGLVRYALSTFGVIISFIVAAQLKGPLTDALGFWTAFNPPLRELWIFIVLYAGITVGMWFGVRALYRTTRLPVVRVVDEFGGAVFGLLFAMVVIVFGLVVMDTFFQTAPSPAVGQAGWLHGLYQTLNDSILVDVFRQTVIPTAGWLARPFVPSEIAEFLRLS